jgi:molybdenum cofactor cytidylyltransferase
MSSHEQAQKPLGAVILAAGDSSRMGRPKALLDRGGETFLDHWLRILREAEIKEIRVVLGRDATLVQKAVDLSERQVVIQRFPEEGMLSSLCLGLGRLPEGLAGCYLCPVDHPVIQVSLLARMQAALLPDSVVVPEHDGRRGHPVLFAAELFQELHDAPLTEGARTVVRADPRRVITVAADAGVLADIDTPDDFKRLDQA